jgi:carbonic anhydrase
VQPTGAAEARAALIDGHARVLLGRPRHPDQSDERRAAVARAPRPWAAVLGCADARVPPEMLFDQGYGSLFVIRVAGNTVSDVAVAGLELAVRDAAVPLVVVLGHTRCRAVDLAWDALDGPQTPTGHMTAVVESLAPALRATAPAARTSERAAATVRENIRLTAARLARTEPVLAPAVHRGALEIAGWLYDVDTGLIEMLV